MTFLHFAVEHRLFLIRRAAVEQVAFFHFANAVENFAAVRQFNLGQFRQNFRLTHGRNLGLRSSFCKRQGFFWAAS